MIKIGQIIVISNIGMGQNTQHSDSIVDVNTLPNGVYEVVGYDYIHWYVICHHGVYKNEKIFYRCNKETLT